MQYLTATKIKARERSKADIPPAAGSTFGGFLANREDNEAYYSELQRATPVMVFEGGRYALVEDHRYVSLIVIDHKNRTVDYVLTWDVVLVRGIPCAASFREWRGPYAYAYARSHGEVSLSMFVMVEVLAAKIPLLFTDRSRFYTYRISRAMCLGMKVYLIDHGHGPRLLTEDDYTTHITWKSDSPIPSNERMCIVSSRDIW